MSHTVVLTCTPSAGIERVWRALTTNAGLAEWFWPQSADADYHFEPRVGADYAIRSEREDWGVHGRVTAVAAPHSLAFTWAWDDPAASTAGDASDDVRFELTPADYQTLVTLTLTIARPDEEDAHVQGWTDALQRLEKVR